MKIVVNFIKILIFILSLYVLAQNSSQYVSIAIFGKLFPEVSLISVIIIALTIGAVLGGIYMALSMVQYQSEIGKLTRKNQQLLKELENLRNISIDEIPDEAFPAIEAPKKSKKGDSAE